MDYSLLFPNRFLKAVEFKGKDVTLTIEKIEIETLEGDKGAKAKGIISFRETKKQLVLNRTNAECLAGMFGRDTDNWLGKRVTLFPAPFADNLGLGVTVAIRVRGSPDIPANKQIEVRLPRKRPVKVTMLKTGPKSNEKSAAPATETTDFVDTDSPLADADLPA